MQRTLVVMVKEPHPGRVKTRLGRDIGLIDAAWWYRHQSAALLRRLRDPRWDLVLAVSPDCAGLRSRVWPDDLLRVPQGRGDLGQRMLRLLAIAPRGPVCLVGSDIPGLRRAHVAGAFAKLGGHDIVFGPATDGGYWLIGVNGRRAVPIDTLRDVRWSGPHALQDSIAAVSDRRIALTTMLRDVDTASDLADIER